MSHAPTEKKRKFRLFPRSMNELVKDATKPLMHSQGKLYGSLLSDWTKIVGDARAAVCRPSRLHFASAQAQEATLHLEVRPAAAPELTYATEQMLEQCARYFGYRVVTRIVLHPTHGSFSTATLSSAPATSATRTPAPAPPVPLATDVPHEMRGILERISGHLASKVVKTD